VGTSIAGVLRHPLVLLAVGAAITGILVPRFTDRYQRRSQDLTLKTGLIKELNEATRPLFESFTQAESTWSTPGSVAAAKHALVVWLEAKESVHDDLDAYFPRAVELQQAWGQLPIRSPGQRGSSATRSTRSRGSRSSGGSRAGAVWPAARSTVTMASGTRTGCEE
jgi:hypothetical protein